MLWDLSDSGTQNRDKGVHPPTSRAQAQRKWGNGLQEKLQRELEHLRGLPHSLGSSLGSGIVDAFIFTHILDNFL